MEVTMTMSEIARNDNGIDRSSDIKDSDGYTKSLTVAIRVAMT